MTTPDDPRARIDELIAAADRVAQRPLPPQRPKWLPAAAIGAIGLIAVVIGVKLATSDDKGSVSPAQTTQVPIAVTTVAPSTTQPVIITLPPTLPPTTVPPSTVPPSTVPPSTTAATTTTVAGSSTTPTRWATFQSGIAHLQGNVPDQATADRLSAIVAAVVGADHVDVMYVVNPATPGLPTSEPVFFPDRFKFAPNASDLSADDIATLDLVMVFMVQNPQVTLDVLAFTDSKGPDGYNLELSQTRANTIWAYLLYSGIAPERVTATGMGEANPIASNDTEEGRAQNRRIEFVVHDLLG
jgi:outer membrane protein OmpA-like peptidoglycan-associated protein